MTLQTFTTLLVIGALTGGIGFMVLKRKVINLAVSLVAGIAGAFLGYFVFRQISPLAIQMLFAIGGGVLMLWFFSRFRR